MDEIGAKLRQLRVNASREKIQASEFARENPLTRTKKAIQQELANAEKYRVSILQQISSFAGTSPVFLTAASQSLEEVYFKQGDVIMRQDEPGDAFYILEEGQVSVLKKISTREGPDLTKELGRFGRDYFFGEVALLTEEPRSASVVVVTAFAKCLRMTKSKFDDITAESKKILAASRDIIIQGAVDQLSFFRSLSSHHKRKVIDAMTVVTFHSGSYICRQGTLGNTFYILTDGECKVTVSQEDSVDEREVARLQAGEFFGEIHWCGDLLH